MKNLHKLLKG
jgi:transposase InsO family protein